MHTVFIFSTSMIFFKSPNLPVFRNELLTCSQSIALKSILSKFGIESSKFLDMMCTFIHYKQIHFFFALAFKDVNPIHFSSYLTLTSMYSFTTRFIHDDYFKVFFLVTKSYKTSNTISKRIPLLQMQLNV